MKSPGGNDLADDRYHNGKKGEGEFIPPSEFSTDLLKFAGSSKIEKADARLISIAGSGRVTGEVRCMDIDCRGSLHVGGSIIANTIRFAGSAEIGGSVSCARAEINGSCKVAGATLVLENMRTSGSVSFGKDLVCGELNSAGLITGESVKAGSVNIDGAGNIHTIVCEKAEINNGRQRSSWLRLKTGPARELRIQSIMAEKEVTLGICEVGELTAGYARLLKSCKVGVLKYREGFDAEDGSVIGRSIKLD